MIYYKIIVFALLLYSQHYCQIIWEKITPDEIISVEAIATNSDGHIFAGTSLNGIYKSTDFGNTWTHHQLEDFQVAILTLEVTPNGTLICGSNGRGVYRSTDNGENWSGTPQVGSDIHSININSSGDIFVANVDGSGGIYRSVDDGENWTWLNLDSLGYYPHTIAINSLDHLFVASSGASVEYDGMSKSTDNGDSWARTNLRNNQITDIAVNSSDELFAVTSNGDLFTSYDDAISWDSTKIAESVIYVIKAASNDHLFFGSLSEGIFRSIDNGNNWDQMNSGLAQLQIWTIHFFGGYVYLGCSDGLYRSKEKIISSVNSSVNINEFKLAQNYPNPFNPNTTIRFDVPEKSYIELKVFDILGNEVKTIVSGDYRSGSHEVKFDATGLSSGIYLYQLKTPKNYISKKMIIIK